MNMLLSELRESHGFKKVNAVHSRPHMSESFRKPFDSDSLEVSRGQGVIINPRQTLDITKARQTNAGHNKH